jgi:hypothetical protein
MRVLSLRGCSVSSTDTTNGCNLLSLILLSNIVMVNYKCLLKYSSKSFRICCCNSDITIYLDPTFFLMIYNIFGKYRLVSLSIFYCVSYGNTASKVPLSNTTSKL